MYQQSSITYRLAHALLISTLTTNLRLELGYELGHLFTLNTAGIMRAPDHTVFVLSPYTRPATRRFAYKLQPMTNPPVIHFCLITSHFITFAHLCNNHTHLELSISRKFRPYIPSHCNLTSSNIAHSLQFLLSSLLTVANSRHTHSRYLSVVIIALSPLDSCPTSLTQIFPALLAHHHSPINHSSSISHLPPIPQIS
jgi:hypothetical protein